MTEHGLAKAYSEKLKHFFLKWLHETFPILFISLFLLADHQQS